MTSCACADMTFEQIREYVRKSRKSWKAACKELGVGVTCTACVRDLQEFLRKKEKP